MEMRSRLFVVFALSLMLVLGAAAPLSIAAHRLSAGPRARGFWTTTRVQAALSHPARPRSRPASRLESRSPSFFVSPGQAQASSLRVADASTPEDRTFGRIFGVDPRFGPYSCSGTSLATPSGSIVLTAGHCIVEGHRWGRHLIFIPAFDHGTRPFGTFAAEAVYTTPQWRRGQNPDFDLAALRVSPNPTGTLSETVGAREYETGRSRYSPFQVFGYPTAALEGQELPSCSSGGLGSDPETFGLAGPPTVPVVCDMAPGSSGGAWIADGGYIDGVTSYSYAHHFGRLYSPYFGAAVGSFLAHLP
jgi:hypothetical protein